MAGEWCYFFLTTLRVMFIRHTVILIVEAGSACCPWATIRAVSAQGTGGFIEFSNFASGDPSDLKLPHDQMTKRDNKLLHEFTQYE